jgi:hypothetical protein
MAYSKPSIFVGRKYNETHDANPKPVNKRHQLRLKTGDVKAIGQCQATARQAYWMARHSKAENAGAWQELGAHYNKIMSDTYMRTFYPAKTSSIVRLAARSMFGLNEGAARLVNGL